MKDLNKTRVVLGTYNTDKNKDFATEVTKEKMESFIEDLTKRFDKVPVENCNPQNTFYAYNDYVKRILEIKEENVVGFLENFSVEENEDMSIVVSADFTPAKEAEGITLTYTEKYKNIGDSEFAIRGFSKLKLKEDFTKVHKLDKVVTWDLKYFDFYKKIDEMFELQRGFNNYSNGEDAINTNITKNGKAIHWDLAILDETLEVIGSTPWKHWKDIDGKIDFKNLEVEIVDLWHFIMSVGIVLENQIGYDKIKEIVSNEYKLLATTNPFKNGISDLKFIKAYAMTNLSLVLELYHNPILNPEHPKVDEYDIRDIYKLERTFTNLVSNHFKIMIKYFNIDIMYAGYLVKNCLNKFRINNGYKEGTYVKHWNFSNSEETLEDNVIANITAEDLNKNNALNFENLYKVLEATYKG